MQKPEKTFRIGAVSASVFVNRAEDGREFRSVSLQRSFKTGEEWKTTTNFTLSDIPAATAVLQLAMHHVAERDGQTESTKRATAAAK